MQVTCEAVRWIWGHWYVIVALAVALIGVAVKAPH